MAAAPGLDGFPGRKDSSFCEQKEAKKLHSLRACVQGGAAGAGEKSFLVLFFKKEHPSFLA